MKDLTLVLQNKCSASEIAPMPYRSDPIHKFPKGKWIGGIELILNSLSKVRLIGSSL